MGIGFLQNVDQSSVQTVLEEAQAKPVVGPLLVSPIKALVSIVEGVVAVALMVIGVLFGGLASDSTLGFLLMIGGQLMAKDALKGFVSSVTNIATFGGGSRHLDAKMIK